jgi:hypothetical protein
MANEPIEEMLDICITRELQNRMTVRHHYTQTGKDVKQQELGFIAGGTTKWYRHLVR